jgi:formiminoglutamase
LGEVVHHLSEDISSVELLVDYLKGRSEKYIILGIPEDIGIRANGGKPGADKAFKTFLSYFLNLQKNQLIDESQFLILGEIAVHDLQEKSKNIAEISALRALCEEVDANVYPVIECIVNHNKIPIVIGGGHNNSYGIIRGVSQGLQSPIQVLNIDPHADFRAEEGRHSGNGFRYAYNQNFLNQYAVFGLQENYNNQTILESFGKDQNLHYTSFSPLLDAASLSESLKKLGPSIGLEIDLDSIKNMPSSAMSPIGYSEEQILEFRTRVSSEKQILYYHLAEGAPAADSQYRVGKFLSHLVSDIIKS